MFDPLLRAGGTPAMLDQQEFKLQGKIGVFTLIHRYRLLLSVLRQSVAAKQHYTNVKEKCKMPFRCERCSADGCVRFARSGDGRRKSWPTAADSPVPLPGP